MLELFISPQMSLNREMWL